MLRSLRRLNTILDPADRGQLGLVFSVILIMAVLDVVGIASILPFMYVVTEPEVIGSNAVLSWCYQTLGFSSDREMLLALGAVVLLLFSVTTIGRVLTQWMIQKLVCSMEHRLCMRKLAIYTRVDYRFYLVNNSSDLLKKVIVDIKNLVSNVLMAIGQLAAQLVTIALIFALLLAVEPFLSLIAIGVFGGSYLVIHFARAGYLSRLGRVQLDAINRRVGTFSDAVNGAKAIRADGVAPYFVARFESASALLASVYPNYRLATLLPGAVVQLLAFGGILSALLYQLAAGNDLTAVLPGITLFTVAGYRLLPAVGSVFMSAAQLVHHAPVIDEVCREIEHDLEPDPVPDRFRFDHEIRLEGVGFRYATRAQVLRAIDLTIPRGARVALVGPTGSGKTTLMDLLIGLLRPQEGTIRIDGEPLTLENASNWRLRVGYVPQEVFLYDETVTRNIAFGVPDDAVDPVAVRRAARLAQIDGFIEAELPGGYDAMIGERGIRLSGGQRQRLGLARAFYRSPEVLLLDEATSALDGATEEAVLSAVRDELKGVTQVMIAHRLSTIRDCDVVVLIEEGRIIAQGTFEQLFESQETFRQMATLRESL